MFREQGIKEAEKELKTKQKQELKPEAPAKSAKQGKGTEIKKNASVLPTQPQQAVGYAAKPSLRDRHF